MFPSPVTPFPPSMTLTNVPSIRFIIVTLDSFTNVMGKAFSLEVAAEAI
jgi:hypothetical protein